jgi:hypothetical protein
MEELLQIEKRSRCAISGGFYVQASIVFTHAGEPFIKSFGRSEAARAIQYDRRRLLMFSIPAVRASPTQRWTTLDRYNKQSRDRLYRKIA